MKYYINTLIIMLALGLLSVEHALAGEGVVVIVNRDNQQSLSQQDIKNIYGDIVAHWDNGKRITVLNLPVDNSAREKFSEEIFGESASRLAAAESNRKITNTIKNPSKTRRARLIVKLVARDPNAIGYIPFEMLDDSSNVKVIFKIE